MHYTHNQEYAFRVLDALEQIALNASQSVRISVLFQLPYFIRWDRSKVVAIFCRMFKSKDHQDVYRAGINTAQYLIKQDFDAVLPFLKDALLHEKCQRDSSVILAQAWLSGKGEALETLKDAWKEYPNSRAAMVDVALANYRNAEPEIRKKANWLYNQFLEDTSAEVIHKYTTSFLHRSLEEFESLLPLLKKYVRSAVARKSPGYYFDYLQKCCRQYPRECIALLKHSLSYDLVNITESGYYDSNKPTKVLIGAYNSLYAEPEKNKKYLRNALHIFDKLLHHPTFRSAAEKVVDTV